MTNAASVRNAQSRFFPTTSSRQTREKEPRFDFARLTSEFAPAAASSAFALAKSASIDASASASRVESTRNSATATSGRRSRNASKSRSAMINTSTSSLAVTVAERSSPVSDDISPNAPPSEILPRIFRSPPRVSTLMVASSSGSKYATLRSSSISALFLIDRLAARTNCDARAPSKMFGSRSPARAPRLRSPRRSS